MWPSEIDYESDYEVSYKSTMEVKRLKTLAVEIFKTINKINSNYMKYVFTSNARVRANHALVKWYNITHFLILFDLNFYPA